MNSYLKDQLKNVLEGLNDEITKCIFSSKRCDFFIAILDSPSSSELFANERHLFCGTDIECRKLFKEAIKIIKKQKDKIQVLGNPKDDYIHIIKKI